MARQYAKLAQQAYAAFQGKGDGGAGGAQGGAMGMLCGLMSSCLGSAGGEAGAGTAGGAGAAYAVGGAQVRQTLGTQISPVSRVVPGRAMLCCFTSTCTVGHLDASMVEFTIA